MLDIGAPTRSIVLCKYRLFRYLKSSTKKFVLAKTHHLKHCFLASEAHFFCCFSAKSLSFCPKTTAFSLQFLSICIAIRQPLLCKTIGIAMQNDRFCTIVTVCFLHTCQRVSPNAHTLNYLSLLTHTWQKNVHRIYFLFYSHSQRG